MSRSPHAPGLLRTAAAGSAAVALALVGSGTARAASPRLAPAAPQTADSACGFSIDGAAFTGRGMLSAPFPSSDGKVTIVVKAGSRQHCQVTLASYLTNGADWKTSGKQTFVGSSSVDVSNGGTGTLVTIVPTAPCYAQVDLYRGLTVFDGETGNGHGPLPNGGKSGVIGNLNIAWWHGGTAACALSTQPPPGTTLGPTPTPTPTPTPPPSVTTTPTPTPTATATATATGTPTSGPSTTPSPSAPSPSTSSPGALAQTGSSNSDTLAGIAVALLLSGAAAVFLLRRRPARGQH